MYVISNNNSVPIKIWSTADSVDEKCLQQAANLAKLPFVHKWISLMPDTHAGKGMPIGGVLACDDVVIPNAVGVDIGCGMAFVQTNIPVRVLRETKTGSGTILQTIIGDILRGVPTGFAHHSKPQSSTVLDKAKQELSRYESSQELVANIEEGYFQIGTLGGGNHFIELQEDENGLCTIMLHSGSRNFGYRICGYFNDIAKSLNERWFSKVEADWGLAFLPVDTHEGEQYLNWMNLAMDFAYENRSVMLENVMAIFSRSVEKYTGLIPEYSNKINCHHNYASLENHYGKNVYVHRKGAIRAREGDLGIIPGAMGSASYIVRGKGNPESFMSSSHGAGRVYSRSKAMELFSVEKVIVDLKQQNVVLGKSKKSDVPEESRFAYKDIDTVMANQSDLTEQIKRLFTVGVVKG